MPLTRRSMLASARSPVKTADVANTSKHAGTPICLAQSVAQSADGLGHPDRIRSAAFAAIDSTTTVAKHGPMSDQPPVDPIALGPMGPDEVRSILKEIGLSQKRLARLLHLNYRTVQLWVDPRKGGCHYFPAVLLLRILRRMPDTLTLIDASLKRPSPTVASRETSLPVRPTLTLETAPCPQNNQATKARKDS